MMERLKQMKEQLITASMNEMTDLSKANTKELGEVIDMIKDLSQTMYYCSIVKAMEEAGKEEYRGTNNYYYTERYMPYQYQRDMDRLEGRMYYSDGEDHDMKEMAHYTEKDYPMMRDGREGRSPIRRKMYMESKATHQDEKAMNDLESYMRDLTQDIMEMITQASPEEKAILQKKMNVLAAKLQNV